MGGTLRLNRGKKRILAAIGSNIFKVASMLAAYSSADLLLRTIRCFACKSSCDGARSG